MHTTKNEIRQSRLSILFTSTVIGLVVNLSACHLNSKPTVEKGRPHYAFEQAKPKSTEYVLCAVEGQNCTSLTMKTLRQPKAMPVATQETSHDKSRLSVFFGFNSAKLSEKSIALLKQNLPTLKSASRIQLRGYTDPIGGTQSRYNQKLAERRALAIKAWLKKQGIQADYSLIHTPPCCALSYEDPASDEERRNMRKVVLEFH